MSKERLIVKDFFTLKDIDIKLDKYNIFIGEQASGKSLLIKLLYYFREILTTYLPIYPQDLITFYQKLWTEFNQLFNLPNQLAGEITYKIENYSINIIITNQAVKFSRNLIELRGECINQLKLDNAFKSNTIRVLQPPELYSTLWNKIYNVKFDFGAMSNKFLPAGRVIFYNLFNNLFNFINNNPQSVNLNPLLIKFGQDYQLAISGFKSAFINDSKYSSQFEKLAIDILKGKFKNDSLGGYIEQNETQIRPIDASSGQQEFLPMYIILRDVLAFGQSNLYIEEPEAHLYPTAQKAIIELLIYVANVTNNEGLYITTHSPYILTVLNNLIIAHDVKDKQSEFNPSLLVPFEKVHVYFIKDGKAHSLRDEENHLIIADDLDKVSEENAIEFEHLLDIKYETVY